jgi:hypothetical protein
MGAAADCEAIIAGFLGQPVNSLTTIAFLLTGIWTLVGRPERRWVGAGLIATGVGSFLFHGPMPPGSEWAHDVSLAWLILLIAATDTRWQGLSRLPALAFLGLAFWLLPGIADPVAVAFTAVAVVSLLARDRSFSTWAPLALLSIVGILGRLGSSQGPWCDPDSVLQMHGLWHVGAAVAVAWWATKAPSDQSSTSL